MESTLFPIKKDMLVNAPRVRSLSVTPNIHFDLSSVPVLYYLNQFISFRMYGHGGQSQQI